MAEIVPETAPAGSPPTSTRTLLLEGLALTVLVISFVRRVIAARRNRMGPLVSHYLPPDVTAGGEFGPSVTRGCPAFVTVTPRTLLAIGATMIGHISYQYTLSGDPFPHTVVVPEMFQFNGGDDDQIKVYTIQTDLTWQTLAATVYGTVYDSNGSQSAQSFCPVSLQ